MAHNHIFCSTLSLSFPQLPAPTDRAVQGYLHRTRFVEGKREGGGKNLSCPPSPPPRKPKKHKKGEKEQKSPCHLGEQKKTLQTSITCKVPPGERGEGKKKCTGGGGELSLNCITSFGGGGDQGEKVRGRFSSLFSLSFIVSEM